jgi:hypothetical protein
LALTTLVALSAPTSGFGQPAGLGHGSIEAGVASLTPDDQAPRSPYGRDDGFVSIAASVFLIKRIAVGIEGTFASTAVDWNIHGSGGHDEFDERFLLATLRPRLLTRSPGGMRGLSLDLVAGIGVVSQEFRSRYHSFTVAGTFERETREVTHALTTGIDAPIALSDHIFFAPSVRMYFVDHAEWETRVAAKITAGWAW